MSATLLIDEIKPKETSCLWKAITSKWIVKYACLFMTLLLLLISASMLFVNFVEIFGGYNFYYDMFLGRHFGIILGFYPIIEGFMLTVAIYGVFAVLTENTAFVRLFGVLTFFAFVINALAGGTMIATAVYKIPRSFSKLRGLIEIYEVDFDAEATINFIQNDQGCCGYYEASDWRAHLSVNEFRNYTDFIAPKSCCIDAHCTSYKNRGCYIKIKLILMMALVKVLIVSSTLSILFLLNVLATFRLKTKLEEAEEVNNLPKVLVGTNQQLELKDVADDTSHPLYDYSLRVQEFSNFLHQNSVLCNNNPKI